MKLQDVANQYLTNKFTFDEASGDVLDTKGSAVGTVYSATRVTGWNGQGSAMSFDGNDYVVFDSKIIPLGKKSIRFKFKKSNVGVKEVIYNDTVGMAHHGNTILITTNGELSWQSNRGSTASRRFEITSPINICDGKWHEVLLVWDGTTNSDGVKMYIDDMTTPATKGTATSAETTAVSHNSRLGAYYDSTKGTYHEYLNGQIDELEIYNDVIDGIITSRFATLKNNTSHYSLDNQTLIHLPSSSDKNMILHGLEEGTEIQLDVPFDKMKYVEDTSEVLGEGKKFEHEIDTTKVKINKLIL